MPLDLGRDQMSDQGVMSTPIFDELLAELDLEHVLETESQESNAD